MDKRALRMASAHDRMINTRSGVFCADAVRYVVYTTIKNIAHRRTLILYVYDKETMSAEAPMPRWTMFQTKDEYVTLYKDDVAEKWFTSAFDNLWTHYDGNRQCAFYSKTDEERIAKFFNSTTTKGLDCLDKVQERLRSQRSRAKQIAKEKIIIDKMKTVKGLPRDIATFMHRETLPHYIFYDYTRSKKQIMGYCTCCKNEVPIADVKHKTAGTCPKCKSKVTFLTRGRRGYIIDRSTAQVIQRVSDNEIVIRFIKSFRKYSKCDIPYFSVYENARKFISWNSEGKCEYTDYYYSYNRGITTQWCKGERPIMNKYCYHFEADGSGMLYHRNLDNVLKDTPFQYSAVKQYYFSDKEPLYVARYLREYTYHPTIEYLVKLGLYRLATYVVYGEAGHHYYSKSDGLDCDGKNICDVLGVAKKDIPFIRAVNPGIGQLKMIKAMIAEGRDPDMELFRWCSMHSISNTESISIPLKYMTSHRLMKYANEFYATHKRQKYGDNGYSSMSNMLSDYKDYLDMSNKLGHDMKSSFVLYPNDLRAEHDRVSNLLKVRASKETDAKIRRLHTQWEQRYGFKKYGFVVVAPKSAKDIINEGDKLHHCVGRYVPQVVNRQCIILFIRSASHPQKPLCTVEIRDGKLIQARIQNNGDPPKEVQKFIDLWERKIVCSPLAVAA